MAQWTGTRKIRIGAAAVAALLGAGTIVAMVNGSSPVNTEKASRPTTPNGSTTRASDVPSTTVPPRSLAEQQGAAGNASDALSAPVGGDVGERRLPSVAPIGARIVKNGSLSLEVKRDGLDESLGRVLTIVSTNGGAVQSSDTSGRTATFVLRIPAERFETAVVDLRRLGKVTGNSLKSDEVTAQYVDLEARLRNLRAQEAVMLDLMRQARTIPDTITVQQQLSQIQGEIEQLEGQRRVLDDQTTFATLSVSISEKGAPVAASNAPKAESQLSRSWHQATDAALAIVGGTIVVLGAVIPLALILGPIVLVIMVARRRRARPVVAS